MYSINSNSTECSIKSVLKQIENARKRVCALNNVTYNKYLLHLSENLQYSFYGTPRKQTVKILLLKT